MLYIALQRAIGWPTLLVPGRVRIRIRARARYTLPSRPASPVPWACTCARRVYERAACAALRCAPVRDTDAACTARINILTCIHTCGQASVHTRTHSLLSAHHPWAARIPETPGEGDKEPRLRPRVRQPPTLPLFCSLFHRAAARYILQRGGARKRGCYLITGYYYLFRARVNPRGDGDMVISILGQFLLALRLVAPSSASAQPLVLASSYPPVPARLVEKIKSSKYIDLKEMLSDNISLLRSLEALHPAVHTGLNLATTPKPQLREVGDIMMWAYIAIRTPDQATRYILLCC